MTQAFPLQWPKNRPRSEIRRDSAFKVHPTKAFEEMMDELHRFGVSGIVISSNIPLRRDGTPYRDGLTELLEDPGIAIYLTRKKRQVCLCCDTYRRPWENCRALSKAIEGFRAMERHGADQVLDQAFEGFTALPSPDSVSDAPDAAWWVILEVSADATVKEIDAAWKEKCRDAGGATIELNAARDAGHAGRG
jgi:hypothetical protein